MNTSSSPSVPYPFKKKTTAWLEKWQSEKNKENVPAFPSPLRPHRPLLRDSTRKPLTDVRIDRSTPRRENPANTAPFFFQEKREQGTALERLHRYVATQPCQASSPATSPTPPPIAKRRRGRPRKHPLPTPTATTQPATDAARRQLFAEREQPPERKAKLRAREYLTYTDEEEEGAAGSDYDVKLEDDLDREETDDETYGSETSKRALPKNNCKRPRLLAPASAVPDEVKQNMSRVGIDTEAIIKLINNEETKENIIQRTGFSPNYVMKLQRRVLRASPALQPRPWHEHKIMGKQLHVLYGLDDQPMFICKELCHILNVSDTSLAYWKKKVNAEEVETSQDFKLMDQCREIFQGRATYTLFPARSLMRMLLEMQTSKQKTFEVPAFGKLLEKVRIYVEEDA